jgi:cell division protein FtsB
LTSELERIKILEGKISQVVEYVDKLVNENEKLKQQIKDLRTEKKNFADQARRIGKLDENLKTYEKEREVIKERIETIINQIDQIEL